MSISIGKIRLKNPVFLAPMSGVTDAAFRMIAHAQGAGLVVSEMVASEELARDRPDMVRRTLGGKTVSPFVIQLAGAKPTGWPKERASRRISGPISSTLTWVALRVRLQAVFPAQRSCAIRITPWD